MRAVKRNFVLMCTFRSDFSETVFQIFCLKNFYFQQSIYIINVVFCCFLASNSFDNWSLSFRFFKWHVHSYPFIDLACLLWPFEFSVSWHMSQILTQTPAPTFHSLIEAETLVNGRSDCASSNNNTRWQQRRCYSHSRVAWKTDWRHLETRADKERQLEVAVETKKGKGFRF